MTEKKLTPRIQRTIISAYGLTATLNSETHQVTFSDNNDVKIVTVDLAASCNRVFYTNRKGKGWGTKTDDRLMAQLLEAYMDVPELETYI